MATSFESGLAAYLGDGHSLDGIEKRMRRVMDLPEKNPRRRRVMARWQSAFKDQIRDEGTVGAIDWGAIDWEKLIETLIKLIKAIIDLFL